MPPANLRLASPLLIEDAMLALIFALLAGVLSLFAIPVQVAFRLTGFNAIEGDVSIRCMFGLLGFRIPIKRDERQKPTSEEDDVSRIHAYKGPASIISRAEKKGGRREKRKATKNHPVALLSHAPARRRLVRLLRDLMQTIRFQEFDLQMRLGLGDPADTGRLWAWLGPLNAVIGHCRRWRITIDPDFMNAIVEFNTHARVVFIPLRLIVLLFTFLFSPSVMHALYSSRNSHG